MGDPMTSIDYPISAVQLYSIHTLWSKYGLGLQSDLRCPSVNGEHSAEFWSHWQVIQGVERNALEAHIRWLDAQKAANAGYEAPPSFASANGPIAPNMEASEEIMGAYTGPSSSTTTLASLSTTTGYPTIQCPGDKYDRRCLFSTKQPGRFKEHFADSHMHTYASYICNCGQTFPRGERGKAAFAKHISDNAACQH